ncbi:MAG TPA: peptidoglycan-binding protein [Clostridia bacterium]|nr:peptidoglycan-binding protein [Clostridia bacterium]
MRERIANIISRIISAQAKRRARRQRAAAAFRRAGGLGALARRIARSVRERSPRAIAALAGVAALIVCLVLLVAFSGGRNEASGAQREVLTTSLVDLVAELTPSPTPTPRPPSTPEPTPTPVSFGKGMTSERVRAIQERLMELGYMDYDEPTDYFGSMTKQAVELFQRRHSLTIDGEVDQETYDRLMREDALPYMVTVGDSGTDVEELQKRLVELDYMDKATGYFGDETAAAVKEFQSRNSLGVDGMIGTLTREALYSEEAVPHSLSYGETGDEVLSYQKRLYNLGYLTTEPDGTFGKDTVAAVKLFQELNGLIADGHIGPMTREILMSGDAQANALTIGMSGDTVKSVQKKLKALGYLGSADGYFGSGTEAAVRAFQKNNGLSVDGKVGRKTMAKLLSDDAVKASPGQPAATPGGGATSTPSPGTSGGATADRFVEIALSKLGSPYRLGAKGPSNFDCSGFVYWCLNQAGVKQAYMTSKTWRSVTKYQRIDDIDDVKKGDVLVFRMSSSRGHVGIVINSEEMVDASSNSGEVVRRPYKTEYWREVFYCAYRIF